MCIEMDKMCKQAKISRVRFPCPVCDKAAKNEIIKCSNCGLLTHHKRVSPRLTENELTDYSTSSDKFICPPCFGRQLGYQIDFARSLHSYVSISYSYKHLLTYILSN